MTVWFHTHGRVPPVPHARPILDRTGEPFWIVWSSTEPFDYLHVMRDCTRARVGSLYFVDLTPGTISIADLWIATDYRQRYLASLLGQALIELAPGWGINRITAEITEQDRQHFPGIVRWAKRSGYIVQRQGGHYTIERDLTSSGSDEAAIGQH